MRQVIQAVETHGRTDAGQLISLARDLPQNDASIAWIIDELNTEPNDQYDHYIDNLSTILLHADPVLLQPYETAILSARHFRPDRHAPFTEQLRMLAWDAPTCWQHLQNFCAVNHDTPAVNDVNLEHAQRIVEALARFGAACEEKVHGLLVCPEKTVGQHSRHWMVPLSVRLTGRARLHSTVPLLIAKLKVDDSDLVNQECAEALTRIGTPDVLHALAQAFPTAPHHFRLYATDPLERIHSDLAVDIGLHLLRQEPEDDIQRSLAQALLCQFALEAIPEA